MQNLCFFLGIMTGMFLPKNETCNISDLVVIFKKVAEGYKNDSMLLNIKIFYEQLKSFLLRSCANFNGNSSRNKEVTGSKLAFFKEIPLLMLTNQNKALFFILINQNEVLCARKKQSSQNSRESVFQGQLKGSISSVIFN